MCRCRRCELPICLAVLARLLLAASVNPPLAFVRPMFPAMAAIDCPAVMLHLACVPEVQQMAEFLVYLGIVVVTLAAIPLGALFLLVLADSVADLPLYRAGNNQDRSDD